MLFFFFFYDHHMWNDKFCEVTITSNKTVSED